MITTNKTQNIGVRIMINNYPDNSLKLQTIKELEEKLIDISGYIGNLGNPNNTETAKVISLALIALKI